jgi:hypothetical protein
MITNLTQEDAHRLPDIPIGTVFEKRFSVETANAKQALASKIVVAFESPSKKHKSVAAFWDGGNNWKVRFSPNELGVWSFHLESGAGTDIDTKEASGAFTCVSYTGRNSIFVHGSIRLSANRRYFEHSDGTPFLWLSDTAWNGPLKSDDEGWEKYLQDRASKGFTTVQFVMTQWIAAATDANGRRAYSVDGGLAVDPSFFARMDAKIRRINDYGMIAAPVLIWDGPLGNQPPSVNPGTSLSDEEIEELANYMVARYGAYQVIWILAGDGDYQGSHAERWKAIGRSVLGNANDRLATIHPQGQQWVFEEFKDEPWFSFVGYQSGHGDSIEDFKWLTEGPAMRDWKTPPLHPIINLEPNYEGHLSYQGRKPFDAHAVRRAAYWSLLAAPTAGVSYGAHGVWSWETALAVPLNHSGTGLAKPWNEAIHLAGSQDMRYLRDFCESVKWWTLEPASDILAEQPGKGNAAEFVSAAKSVSGNLFVLYLPAANAIKLNPGKLTPGAVARWFDPAQGQWVESARVPASGELRPPGQHDWVVWIGPAKTH